MKWPYYQKDVNQVTLNNSTLQNLALPIFKVFVQISLNANSNFLECEPSLESNFPDICALCETNLDDSIDSGNFISRDFLLLIQKHSFTHMHGLAIYVKKGLPFFTQD